MFTSDRTLSHSLSNSVSFALITSVEIGKNSKNSFFLQTLNPFLCYLGLFAKNVHLRKNYFFGDSFFETNLDFSKHHLLFKFLVSIIFGR